MTDAVIIASIAAASSTGAAFIGLLNNRAAMMARAAAEVTALAAAKQMQEIHVLVNSGMTKALADLAGAQEEIQVLRELVQALTTRLDRKDPL